MPLGHQRRWSSPWWGWLQMSVGQGFPTETRDCPHLRVSALGTPPHQRDRRPQEDCLVQGCKAEQGLTPGGIPASVLSSSAVRFCHLAPVWAWGASGDRASLSESAAALGCRFSGFYWETASSALEWHARPRSWERCPWPAGFSLLGDNILYSAACSSLTSEST